MSKHIELTASDDVKSFNYCTQLINIHGCGWIQGIDGLTNAIRHTSVSTMLLKQFADEATSLEELREKAKNLKAEIDRLHNYVWDFKENEDRIALEKYKKDQEEWERKHPKTVYDDRYDIVYNDVIDAILEEECNESDTHLLK